MNLGKLVFAQITQYLPLTTFRRCVARYGGGHKVKSFSCLDHYLCMAFAQLTYRESLRDIEACLRAQAGKLYHMGIKSRVSRSTLADANESRDWRIYADFAQSLIAIARRLYAAESFGVDLNDTVYALDASTIDLCLSVFPWAPFRSCSAASTRAKTSIRPCVVSDSKIPQPASGWCFSPTISSCQRSPSPSFIVAAGRSSCFSNGSSSIFVSKSFSAPPRTPSKPKSGLPSRFTCSSPSSKSDSTCRRACMKCYRS